MLAQPSVGFWAVGPERSLRGGMEALVGAPSRVSLSWDVTVPFSPAYPSLARGDTGPAPGSHQRTQEVEGQCPGVGHTQCNDTGSRGNTDHVVVTGGTGL